MSYNPTQGSWQEKTVFTVYMLCIGAFLLMIGLPSTPNPQRIVFFISACIIAGMMWLHLYVVKCILDNKDRTNTCWHIANTVSILGSILVVSSTINTLVSTKSLA